MTYLENLQEEDNLFLHIFGHPDYLISTHDGTIRHISGSPLTEYIHKASVRLYRRCKFGLIHRLLMESHLGRPLETSEQVQHQNGNTFDNAIHNLRIGSARQNALDKILSNTNGLKLRNQDVRDIRMLASSLPTSAIADRYDITPGHVRAILTGRSWFNLP